MRKLSEIAKIIRSKNAGPFLLTLDIIFDNRRCMEEVYKNITKKLIADLYKVSPTEVEIYRYDPASAIKINIPRSVPSGHPGDTDVYGAQQHAPLLNLELEVSCEG